MPIRQLLDSLIAHVMPVRRALLAVLVSAGFMALVAGLALAFQWFNWNWVVYSILIGAIFGLLAGLIVLVRVPWTVQLAAVGGITGMGIDLTVTAGLDAAPATALNSLARLVAGTVDATRGAATQTGVPSPVQLPLTVGIWVFLAAVALVMLIGLIFEEHEK